MMPISENKTLPAFSQIILSKCALVATNDPEIYSNFRTNILQRFIFWIMDCGQYKNQSIVKVEFRNLEI